MQGLTRAAGRGARVSRRAGCGGRAADHDAGSSRAKPARPRSPAGRGWPLPAAAELCHDAGGGLGAAVGGLCTQGAGNCNRGRACLSGRMQNCTLGTCLAPCLGRRVAVAVAGHWSRRVGENAVTALARVRQCSRLAAARWAPQVARRPPRRQLQQLGVPVPQMTVRDALNTAMDEEMARDGKVRGRGLLRQEAALSAAAAPLAVPKVHAGMPKRRQPPQSHRRSARPAGVHPG